MEPEACFAGVAQTHAAFAAGDSRIHQEREHPSDVAVEAASPVVGVHSEAYFLASQQAPAVQAPVALAVVVVRSAVVQRYLPEEWERETQKTDPEERQQAMVTAR